MASKWADFITRNGDKEAFKAAKAHVRSYAFVCNEL